MSPTWRYFRTFELREALAHTDAGGIAVHDSGQLRAGKSSAHLLAGTPRDLMNAADELGLDGKYLQQRSRPHFDLWGEVLMRALLKCHQAEAAAEEKGEP